VDGAFAHVDAVAMAGGRYGYRVIVAGRLRVSRSLTGLGPGPHRIQVDDGRALTAGVYFVRLIHGRDVRTTRGPIVR
jgi:hypothetical protein